MQSTSLDGDTTTRAPTVRGVQSADFWTVADRVWPFLENFASRDVDGISAEEIATSIASAQRQLWVIGDFQAVCITAVTKDAVRIQMCAGVRRNEWQQAVDEAIRAWALALGKKRIVAMARPGWARFGKTQGYKERHRQMVLELT